MKIEITYYIGKKDLNRLMRLMDLYREGEGVYWKETATATLKQGVKPSKQWREKFIKAYTQAWDQTGFEVCNFSFKQIL